MLFCQSTTADGLSKDMIRNLSRIGYAFLSLSQEWGTVLKAFLGKEQGQAFEVTVAHFHPKIWGVTPGCDIFRVQTLVVMIKTSTPLTEQKNIEK